MKGDISMPTFKDPRYLAEELQKDNELKEKKEELIAPTKAGEELSSYSSEEHEDDSKNKPNKKTNDEDQSDGEDRWNLAFDKLEQERPKQKDLLEELRGYEDKEGRKAILEIISILSQGDE